MATLTPAQRATLARELGVADRSLSLTAFLERVTPRHAPVPWHLARLVGVLESAAQTPRRVLVSMPPRHGKSATVIAALAWVTERWPERLNGYASYAQRFANTQSRKVRRLAQEAGVSLADDAAAVTEWRTPQGGGLVATGIGGPLTGIGIDGLLVIDDPVKGREQAESPAVREGTWEWFTDVAYTRLEPGSSCVVVATRWHHEDLIGRLERSGQGWEVINLPAVRGADGAPADEGEALWPERFPLHDLRALRAQIGEYTWASLYQGHPVPRAGILFREPTRYATRREGASVILACDPAGSASTRADYTAAVALATYATPEGLAADVLEVVRFQKDTAGAARELEAFQQRHGMAKLHIESSRDGKAIAGALRAINPRLRIAEVPPLGDKFTRAQPVIAAWNHGRVRVPERAPWLGDFLAEVERFTGVSDRHDDQVDALAHAWNARATSAPTVPRGPRPILSPFG